MLLPGVGCGEVRGASCQRRSSRSAPSGCIRAQRVDPDPVPTELDGHGPRTAGHPPWRRCSGRSPPLPASPLVDDMLMITPPVALLDQHLATAWADEEHATQVDRHHAVPVLGGDLQERLAPRGAGVVGEDVQATQRPGRGLDERGGAVLVADVRRDSRAPRRGPAGASPSTATSSGSRPPMKTRHPSSRNRRAAAAPMPLLPPLTRTRLPRRPRMALLRSLFEVLRYAVDISTQTLVRT